MDLNRALREAVNKEVTDAEEILNLSDQCLAIDNTASFPLQCKITAQVQLCCFDEAEISVKALRSSSLPDAEKPFFDFMLGYILYRQGRFVEAKLHLQSLLPVSGHFESAVAQEKLIASVRDCNPRLLHLYAQTLYNLEDFKGAAAIYKAILTHQMFRDNVERDETTINLAACLAQKASIPVCTTDCEQATYASTTAPGLEAHSAVRTHASETTYDMLYNVGTGYAMNQEPAPALAALAEAEYLCQFEHGRVIEDSAELMFTLAEKLNGGANGTTSSQLCGGWGAGFRKNKRKKTSGGSSNKAASLFGALGSGVLCDDEPALLVYCHNVAAIVVQQAYAYAQAAELTIHFEESDCPDLKTDTRATTTLAQIRADSAPQVLFSTSSSILRMKAQRLLSAILALRPQSVATLATATLNTVVLQGHDDFFDTHRKLKLLQHAAVVEKLTSAQRLFVTYNKCLVLLSSFNNKCDSKGTFVTKPSTKEKDKDDKNRITPAKKNCGVSNECKLLASTMIREHPESLLSLMAQTAVLNAELSPRQAELRLINLIKSMQKLSNYKGYNLAAALTLAQLALERGDVRAAMERILPGDNTANASEQCSSFPVAACPSVFATMVVTYVKGVVETSNLTTPIGTTNWVYQPDIKAARSLVRDAMCRYVDPNQKEMTASFLRSLAELGVAFPMLLTEAEEAFNHLLQNSDQNTSTSSNSNKKQHWLYVAGLTLAVLHKNKPQAAFDLVQKHLLNVIQNEGDVTHVQNVVDSNIAHIILSTSKDFCESTAERVESELPSKSALERAGFVRSSAVVISSSVASTTLRSSRRRPMKHPPRPIREREEKKQQILAQMAHQQLQVDKEHSTKSSDAKNKASFEIEVEAQLGPLPELDAERWYPWKHRSYVKAMPAFRRREACRQRAMDDAQRRKKRKQLLEKQQQ